MLGVLGIIQEDGRLLMIQRSATVRVPFAWCFPGGQIEDGESQEQALVREMQEEIGVRVEPGRLLMTQTKHNGGLRLHCWSASIIEGSVTPNSKEIADTKWMTPDEIRTASGVLPGTTAILDTIGL